MVKFKLRLSVLLILGLLVCKSNFTMEMPEDYLGGFFNGIEDVQLIHNLAQAIISGPEEAQAILARIRNFPAERKFKILTTNFIFFFKYVNLP